MTFSAFTVLAALSTVDAVAILLNSPNAIGVKTYAAAKELLEREAAEGKPLQQFVVGVTTSDKKLAEKYLNASRARIRQLAEEKDNSMAWYLLSMESNDMQLLRKAAKGGNVQALNALGTIAITEACSRSRETTNGVEQVLAQGYDCFCRAAAQRDPNGFINLGTCYLRGFGCKQDMALAFSCFKAAAEFGHPEGMDNMSACYQFGHGVEKNSELSLYWAMRGRAARGDEAAAKWLRERK